MIDVYTLTSAPSKLNKTIVVVLTLLFMCVISFIIHHLACQPVPSTVRHEMLLKAHRLINSTMLGSQASSSDTFYSLDSVCNPNQNDSSSILRARTFDNIYETGYWGTQESRSGGGSSIEGAFDWIRHLRSLFKHLDIQSVADIPCGDTYWQFSVRELNTVRHLYFGGDISSYVIRQNHRLYSSQRNKLFQQWDIVRCPVPTFSLKNSTHELKGKQ